LKSDASNKSSSPSGDGLVALAGAAYSGVRALQDQNIMSFNLSQSLVASLSKPLPSISKLDPANYQWSRNKFVKYMPDISR
jgi:hypothetical protein